MFRREWSALVEGEQLTGTEGAELKEWLAK
jgi:hypothetical protein